MPGWATSGQWWVRSCPTRRNGSPGGRRRSLPRGPSPPSASCWWRGRSAPGRRSRPGSRTRTSCGMRSPMTKREVRAAALSLLEVEEDDVLWDVGAGTGSVSVELALLARQGGGCTPWAEGRGPLLICANRTRFGAWNLVPVRGPRPPRWRTCPPRTASLWGQRRGAGRHPGRALGKIPGSPVRQRHRPGDPVRCCGGLCRPGAGGPGDPDLGGPVQGGRWAEPDDGAESVWLISGRRRRRRHERAGTQPPR